MTTHATTREPAAATSRAAEIAAYGDRILAIEPAGIEPVPAGARHGKPLGLLWTWTSPNMEFATAFVGVLAVGILGLGFWPAVLALVLGTALGAVAHGLLGVVGPRFGVTQMVAGRSAFGFSGNALPAVLNALTAGIGWFAVNSVSAAYALNTLLDWPLVLCLFVVVILQVAVACFGHNFVHTAEKYTFPVLTLVFVAAAAVILGNSRPGSATGAHAAPGAFWLAAGAAFGYAAGWNPYAADYTRYLPATTARWKTALWPAVGVFVSCAFLEIIGAASSTVLIPDGIASKLSLTGAFTYSLPSWLADLTLLAIALGGIAANALNIYSGSLSFVAIGRGLPARMNRAVVALLFGVVGTLVAWSGLSNSGTKYENFLLVISYWIGPWLGVTFLERFLSRARSDADTAALLQDTTYRNWAAPIAMAVGTALGVWLFSNQTDYVGLVAKQYPGIGDLAFAAGFTIAVLLHLVLRRVPGLVRTPVTGAPGAVVG